jgi:hypothetical protein
MDSGEQIKPCSKCGINKPLDEFYSASKTKDSKRPECKVCFKLKSKEIYYDNQERYVNYTREYYKNNPDKIKLARQIYRKNNLDKVKKDIKQWRLKNPHKEREYSKKRRELYPYKEAWRATLKNSLKRFNKQKEGHTIDLLGYSALELKNHIESLFTDGMSWENYGEWHIDHIIPVSKFHPDTPANVVNNLSNLQPLWATTREINGVIYEGNLNKGS